MWTVPDDYFEIDDQGDQGAPAPLFNQNRIMEQKAFVPGSLVFDTGDDPCPKNLGLYIYNPLRGRSMTLPCRSRLCPSCGKGWSSAWQDKLEWNEFFHKDDKALTITSAYDPGHKKFWLALKLFWRNIRTYNHKRPVVIDKDTGEIVRDHELFLKVNDQGARKWLPLRQWKIAGQPGTYKIVRPYRNVEFFGIVEYNQKKTQPHFHFVLRSGYIPQKIVKKCWIKAQNAAGFEKIAFDVRIETIKSSVKQYFFKYITKLSGGKDELPKPGQWAGRNVRYSRAFFACKAPLMTSAIKLQNSTIRGDYSAWYAVYSRSAHIAVQKLDIEFLHASALELVCSPWNPHDDQARAGVPKIFDKLQGRFEPFSWELLTSVEPAISTSQQHFSPGENFPFHLNPEPGSLLVEH